MAALKKPNINLVIKNDLGDSYTSQFLSWILTYGRYIIIVIQILVLSVFFLRFKIDRDHTDLKESVTQKQALVESISDLENEIRRIQKRLTDIDSITLDQEPVLKVLRYLQDQTPSDTSYSNLSVNAGKISFRATSVSLKSFSYFLRQLQQNNRFSEVSLDEITRRTDGRIEFKIDAKIFIKNFT